MKTRRLLSAAICLGALWGFRADAHPYASGVTNKNGVISWVLNEPATDVKIVFDHNTVTNDLGTNTVMGTNTFNLNNHTNFSIVVYKVGSNALNQISSDNNVNNSFWGPRGVTVNKSPKDWNFGRVYVANSNPGSAPLRTVTKGIYALDAASGDCLNLGNTASTAGMALGSSTTYGPFRLCVATDDNLYVGDGSTGTIGGVWRVDPNLISSANIFGLASASANTTTSGTNFGRAVGTPNVTGTLAGGNLVLTLVAWDLNLANSSGGFNSTALGYQNIYKYNIGGAALPWKSFPTVITNPIGIGTVNGVQTDMEVAPDGKYFLSTARSSTSDGTTNICVLSSNGVVLWDSKSQSASYFHDTVNDHLCIDDYSVAVSPDDKYVVIQGQVNNIFLLMSLTNGVPDISTLTTNSTVGANGGSTCYAATWDAADNIYVTSGGSDTLRIFSLGLTTTCVTSNDLTCTNGGFQMTATSAALAAIQTQPANVTAQCSGNATFSVGASGAALQYQWYLAGSGAVPGATNSALALTGVSLSESGRSYSVVVYNSSNSVTSRTAVLTVIDTTPPVITLNGGATIYTPVGTAFTDPGASAFDACAGSLSVATSGSVNVNIAGTNHLSYSAADPSGNSATNTRTVIVLATNGAPVIAQQPSNQVVQCLSPATLSVLAGGAQPFSYQWYDGATPLTNGAAIAGATSPTLTLSDALLAQGGSYSVVITNTSGSAASQTAKVTVNDLSPPVVTVTGSTVINLAQGASYTDAGATAMDACVGSLAVTSSGSVNPNTPGIYVINYVATNPGGLAGGALRTVIVTATNGPVTAAALNLIPLPVTVSNRPGLFLLCPAQPAAPAPGRALVKILVDASSRQTGQYLADELAKSTGYQFRLAASTATNAVRGAILITVSNAIGTLGAEGYELTVAPDSVLIRAPAQGGTFYGVQTLLQLLPPQIYSPQPVPGVAWVAPCVYIQDYPQFPWRGVMLDVARHFYSKDEVKRFLDAMAMHKLNTFHWHLVDDQGWRLQLTNYPNLAVASAYRASMDYGLPPRATTETNSAGQYGGYYTQAEAREVVAYAQQRHITIVPEIEMPCHSTCALAAYPQFGCGNPVGDYDMDYPSINYGVDLYSLGTPGTMAFLEDALTEVMGIFPGKYIHCGGDEVVSSGDTQWNSYPADVTNMMAHGITPNGTNSITQYQNWFSTTLSSFLKAQGRTMIGWTEFEWGGVVPNAALMDWKPASYQYSLPVAEAGLPVVPVWEDFCYINDNETTSTSAEPPNAPGYLPLSTVYSLNPIPAGLPSQYNSNILGSECVMFGEEVPSFENVMFKTFPRGAAMAEVTWTPLALQNYSSFTTRLITQEQRYAQMNLNYDHESIPTLGTWGPTVSTNGALLFWDFGGATTTAGEIDVNFIYGSGGDGLAITSVALLENNVQVDIDVHAGFAGAAPSYPMYILHLPQAKPGAVYTIEAVVAGVGGSSSSGTVYLPNWN